MSEICISIFELRQWDAQVPNQIFAGVGDAGDDIPFGEMGWPGCWEINCVKLCVKTGSVGPDN